MALKYLADTSVLTRLHLPRIREAVEGRLARGEVGRATISDLEIGFSARSASEWDRLSNGLAVFDEVEILPQHFVRALQVQRMLARRGQRGRKIPDLLIAAAAEDAGLAVLHYDSDFDLISRATGQVSEWVMPAGSIS